METYWLQGINSLSCTGEKQSESPLSASASKAEGGKLEGSRCPGYCGALETLMKRTEDGGISALRV